MSQLLQALLDKSSKKQAKLPRRLNTQWIGLLGSKGLKTQISPPGIWYYQNIPKPFGRGMEWINPERRERFEKGYIKQKSVRQSDAKAKAPIQRSNMFFIIMLAELFGCWYADLEKLTFSRGYRDTINVKWNQMSRISDLKFCTAQNGTVSYSALVLLSLSDFSAVSCIFCEPPLSYLGYCKDSVFHWLLWVMGQVSSMRFYGKHVHPLKLRGIG